MENNRPTALSPEIPYMSVFSAFLAPNLDRCAFIDLWLRAREIPHTIVELAGKRHIVVRFATSSYDPRFRMKTLVAHYDRAAGSPGANDNSAACFQLMLFAERLMSAKYGCHNIRIFFTDGEEAAGTKGIAGQGAFALGSGFRKLKMTEDDVYVFDVCGRGDTLILSTAGMECKGAVGKSLTAIHEKATRLAQVTANERWMRLFTPYSDNAGFLAAGIASQIITVLPHQEAETLERAFISESADQPKKSKKKHSVLEACIVKNRYDSENTQGFSSIIPKTWQLMHTKDDSENTLNIEAFGLIAHFLDTLASRIEIAI
jgi:hypothetical protein